MGSMAAIGYLWQSEKLVGQAFSCHVAGVFLTGKHRRHDRLCRYGALECRCDAVFSYVYSGHHSRGIAGPLF